MNGESMTGKNEKDYLFTVPAFAQSSAKTEKIKKYMEVMGVYVQRIDEYAYP
jgi:hypothetical protein